MIWYVELVINRKPNSSMFHNEFTGFSTKTLRTWIIIFRRTLIAPRIPFMQLRENPRGGQLSISENVVNVPADVMSTVNKLPRMLTEDETIELKFKHSLNYLGGGHYQTCFGCWIWPLFSFPGNYKPCLNQTCLDDASRDGYYQTCFGCWIWPTFLFPSNYKPYLNQTDQILYTYKFSCCFTNISSAGYSCPMDIFLVNFSLTTGPIFTKLGTKHPRVRGNLICQMKCKVPSQGEIINKRQKKIFIFHMCIPCDRPFFAYHQIWPLDLGVWPTFNQKFQTFTLAIILQW